MGSKSGCLEERAKAKELECIPGELIEVSELITYIEENAVAGPEGPEGPEGPQGEGAGDYLLLTGGTMIGMIELTSDEPTLGVHAVNKDYVDNNSGSDRVLKSGDTMTGNLVHENSVGLNGRLVDGTEIPLVRVNDTDVIVIGSDGTNISVVGDDFTFAGNGPTVSEPQLDNSAALTRKDYVDTLVNDVVDNKVDIAGDTMTGSLALDSENAVDIILSISDDTFTSEFHTNKIIFSNGTNNFEMIYDEFTHEMDCKINDNTVMIWANESAPKTKYQPTDTNHLTRKDYVDGLSDDLVSTKVDRAGDTMTGTLRIGDGTTGENVVVRAATTEGDRATLALADSDDNVRGLAYYSGITDQVVFARYDAVNTMMSQIILGSDGVSIGGRDGGYPVIEDDQDIPTKKYVDDANTAQDGLIEDKAPLVHTHTIAQVTDLQGALDAKYNESEHVNVSTGVAEAAKPIVLNGNGKIDPTMLDIEGGYTNQGQWTPVVDAEYPDTDGMPSGSFWMVVNVADPEGYTFTTGDLDTYTIYNGELMLWAGAVWNIHIVKINPLDYYKLDGTNAIEANFAAGGFKLVNIADGVDVKDAVNVGQISGFATQFVEIAGSTMTGNLNFLNTNGIILQDTTGTDKSALRMDSTNVVIINDTQRSAFAKNKWDFDTVPSSYEAPVNADDLTRKDYVDAENDAQNTTIGSKADKTYVDSENTAQDTASELKADITYVDSENATQDTAIQLNTNKVTGADRVLQADYDVAMPLKADITYVDSENSTQDTATALVQTNLDTHEALTDNPHGVIYSQIGAEPTVAVGTAGQVWATNATADGKEWINPPSTVVNWGDIQGTLSHQTDLQAVLDTKVMTAQENGVGTLLGNAIVVTQAEYDALTPVATTMYMIVG